MGNITQPLQEQKLAFSRKNRTYISVPGNLAFGRKIQMHSNQRTNRVLSRVSIGDTVTPIWHQQTFSPSDELKKRFTPPTSQMPTDNPVAQAVQTNNPAVQAPNVSANTDSKNVSPPVTSTTSTTQVTTSPDVGQNQNPSVTTQPIQKLPVQPSRTDPTPATPTAPQTKTITPSVVQPANTAVPISQEPKEATPPPQTDVKTVNPRAQTSNSDTIAEPSKQTTPLPIAPTNTQSSKVGQIATDIPIESTNKNVADLKPNESLVNETQKNPQQDVSNQDIALSITALSDIRQQIKEQEERLHSLQQELPQTEEQATQYLAEMKTKEALIKNLEHALANTQEELNMLRSTPGADQSVITNLETQLKKQRDTFNNLKHDKKLIEEKQIALQKKKDQQSKVNQTINQLQQQSTQLQQMSAPQPTAPTAPATDTSTIDPAVRDLINQSMAIQEQSPAKPTPQPQPVTTSNPPPHEPPKEIKMPTITKEKNAINGIVMNAANKLITDAIVIIKNEEGRPLRALKTNDLGQFWITTALDDGRYFIESEKEGFRFDTIEIELTGEVVPPILVKAK